MTLFIHPLFLFFSESLAAQFRHASMELDTSKKQVESLENRLEHAELSFASEQAQLTDRVRVLTSTNRELREDFEKNYCEQ